MLELPDIAPSAQIFQVEKITEKDFMMMDIAFNVVSHVQSQRTYLTSS